MPSHAKPNSGPTAPSASFLAALEAAREAERKAALAFIRADIADMAADPEAAMFAHERIYAAGLVERIEAGEHVAGVKQSLTTAPTVKQSLTVADAICPMCDGRGFKDYAGFCLEPCECREPVSNRYKLQTRHALFVAAVCAWGAAFALTPHWTGTALFCAGWLVAWWGGQTPVQECAA